MEIEDIVTIVQERMAVPLLIRWNVSAALRNDQSFPASINVAERPEEGKEWEKITQNPTKIRHDESDEDLPNYNQNPTEAEIEEVRQQLIQEYADVFTDDEEKLKPMRCEPSRVELVEEAKPIRVSTARKIAYAYREETKKELDRMVDQGIVVPVGDVATEWCHPMVVVEKSNGGIRICVDLTKVNKYVKRPTHPGPSPREIVNDIPPNQRFFSTLDAVKGYWQIPLEKGSQALTTFITPWGRYIFTRAPMGLS